MKTIKQYGVKDCQQNIEFIKESILGKTVTGYFEADYEDGETSMIIHFGDVALCINACLNDKSFSVLRAVDSLEITS
jgi:hypothetical protein